MQVLTMCVNGPVKCSATGFKNLLGIWSAPVEQSDLRRLFHIIPLHVLPRAVQSWFDCYRGDFRQVQTNQYH